MDTKMWCITFLINNFEEIYVKTERDKNGRASLGKGDIMWNGL